MDQHVQNAKRGELVFLYHETEIKSKSTLNDGKHVKVMQSIRPVP